MTGSEDDGSSKGPSKFGVASTAWSTYSDLKKLMEGDPIGAVGLFGDAGKWAQLLIPEAIATPVIQYGMYVLTGISKSMGVGSPDGGGAFNDGAKLFQSNGKSLEGAYPTETWSGSASDAYTSQNSHQIQRASTMLEADNSIVRILSTQAGQVHHARTEVDWASKGLAAMIPVAMALEATVLGAPESIALQFAAVAVASAVAGAAATNLYSYAQDNAAQIREATEKYRQAGSGNAPSRGSPGAPPDSGDQNGSDSPGTPSEPGQSAPTSNGNPSGQSGRGSGSGGGSGSGSGSPTTPSMPHMPGSTGAPTTTSSTASTGAGMGGMPSLPQMGGGSAGGGAGMFGGLTGAAGQVAQAVTQAVQQANQQNPNAQNASERDGAQSGGERSANPDSPNPAPEQSGVGAETHAGRAPIHASFDAVAANRTAPQHLRSGQ